MSYTFVCMMDYMELLKLIGLICTPIALIISILSFLYKIHKDKEIADKNSTTSNSKVTSKTESKHIDDNNRFKEQPYIVFRSLKNESQTDIGTFDIELTFQNKGKGPAYALQANIGISNFSSNDDVWILSESIDQVALEGELFKTHFTFFCTDDVTSICLDIEPSLLYEDSSGRSYKQTFKISTYLGIENYSLEDCSKPILVK